MKLIPYHQDDKDGSREYRSPDGTWRVVRTPRDNGRRNDRSRWEVHDRHEDRVGGWHHHAAFERRRDALVFLDTTAAAPGSENVTTVPPKRPKTPELSQEPSQSSPRRTAKGPITHDLDETRSQDIPWSLCGVLLYDSRQIAPVYQPNVARPRTPLLAPPCSGLSRRCASMPSSRLRLPRFSSPRP